MQFDHFLTETTVSMSRRKGTPFLLNMNAHRLMLCKTNSNLFRCAYFNFNPWRMNANIFYGKQNCFNRTHMIISTLYTTIAHSGTVGFCFSPLTGSISAFLGSLLLRISFLLEQQSTLICYFFEFPCLFLTVLHIICFFYQVWVQNLVFVWYMLLQKKNEFKSKVIFCVNFFNILTPQRIAKNKMAERIPSPDKNQLTIRVKHKIIKHILCSSDLRIRICCSMLHKALLVVANQCSCFRPQIIKP